MKSRGDTQVLMATALAGLVLAVCAYVAGEWRGANRGRAEVQAKWDAQKLADVAAGQARDRATLKAIDRAQESAAAAAKLAAENETKWKEALRDAQRNRKPLGTCVTERGPTEPVQPGGSARPEEHAPADGATAPAPRLLVLWRFVGLHDGAFTGLDGQPLFGDSSQFALDDSRADAPSPYGLDDLIAVNGENARALSSCRSAYAQALEALDAAAAAWETKQ
jgi:hypothetical protein